MKKRSVSYILTLTLVLSMIPAFTLTASAAGETAYYVKTDGDDS